MLSAHYKGRLNMSDYWAVGDIRKETISEIATGSTHTSQSSQDIELVIIGFNHDKVYGENKVAAVTIQTKNCLSNTNRMNESYTVGSADTTLGWYGIDMYKWCNSKFKSALPSGLKNLIVEGISKKSNIYCHSSYSGYSNYRKQDESPTDIFLLSEYEIFGTMKLSSSTYGSLSSDGTQYEYMKTTANRIKTRSGYTSYWWGRTMYIDYSAGSGRVNFITVGSDGSSQGLYIATDDYGVAPAFCL